MNASTLISLLGLTGGTLPALPGQLPGNGQGGPADPSSFADSLSLALAGGMQVQSPLPLPAAQMTIGNPFAATAINTESDAVGSVLQAGNPDLTTPLLGGDPGMVGNLAASVGPASGKAAEQGMQHAQQTPPVSPTHSGLMPATADVDPAESLDLIIETAGPTLADNDAGLTTLANLAERHIPSATKAAEPSVVSIVAGSLNENAQQPGRASDGQRHSLVNQAHSAEIAARPVIDKPVDPSKIATDAGFHPQFVREERPRNAQAATPVTTSLVSSSAFGSTSEMLRPDLAPLVTVKSQGTNANPAAPATQAPKSSSAALTQASPASTLVMDSALTPEAYAEQVDIVGAETGRVDQAASTAPKSEPQQAQAPNTQIALHIARAIPQGVDRFSVQLRPAELGAVDIQLDFTDDGHVSALITAERPETLDLLQRDSRALERSLHNVGLQLENGGLSFSLKQDQGNQGEGFGTASQQQDQRHAGGRGRGDDHGPATEQEPSRLSLERLLDIRA